MLTTIWAYRIQIWGCAKPSQTKTIQAFQSITLHLLTSAPWYSGMLPITHSTMTSKLKPLPQLHPNIIKYSTPNLPTTTTPL